MATIAVRTFTRVRTNPIRYSLHTSTQFTLLAPPPSRSYSSPSPRRPASSLPTLTPSSPPTRPTTLTIHRPHSPFQPHQSRPFSLLPLMDTAVATSQTLLHTLHAAAGTPWYLTIPLFALALNLLTRLPTTLYSRRVAVRRQLLQPLQLAWMATRVGPHPSAAAARAAQLPRSSVDRAVATGNAAMRARHRRWGVQAWKDWVPGLAVVPVWIAGIEALRRSCGGPKGLLGVVLSGVDGRGGFEKNGVARVDGDVVDDGSKTVAEGDLSGDLSGDLAPLATGQAEVQDGLARYLADPSLAAGGCLWFPDLTVADPFHVLPIALSAILVFNVMPKSLAQRRVLLGMESTPVGAIGVVKSRLRLQRALLLVAMAAGPVTMGFPAALHLYWICSALLTTALTRIISRLMPMPKVVPPAKSREPMLVMPTREGRKKP
ncbi:hypothetical protein N658DRAFT_526448 [Parathielavia hyrcaniae]|uniref:Uncharacterized protein n=1 Tax=Parathielavia hyrcaniae TaxID=113614 RepID=A0AAN6PY71_9PEZI|nr:hypothetical protein N658DRAFT_526448 [Parathielavia hyrcaniae]